MINGTSIGGGISGAFPSSETNKAQPKASADGSGNFIEELVSKVSDLQSQANDKIKGMVTGQSRELHDVMLAVEKANISFQFLTQVRNKALDAYQEIMKMQV